MDRLKEALCDIGSLDDDVMQRTQYKLDNLTKPRGSLGRLEDLAIQICGITRKEAPSLSVKVIFTLASDHGVTEEGVSAFPKEVTSQMVHNFLNGGAGINVLARHTGARVVVADVGVASAIPPHKDLVTKKIGLGTKNMVKGPAMTREDAIRSVEAGIEIAECEFKKGIDIAGTGDMGIGNTTASSAITAVITGASVDDVTGRGTGIDNEALTRKAELIKKAIAVNKPDQNDGLDVLAKVGGFEIGALAGVIIACAANRVPVVIDGFISGAAALIAYRMEPKVKEYMIASHCSVEKGHRIILDYLGLKPLLDLNLRLGEGTGSALAMNIVEAGVKILNEMATFKTAGVSEKSA